MHGVALTSLDGNSWTQSATNPADLDAGAPVFTDGRWYAAGTRRTTRTPGGPATPSGFDLLSSPDGMAWTQAGRIPYTPSSSSASGVAVLGLAVGGSASTTAPSAPTAVEPRPARRPPRRRRRTTVALANPETGGGTILVSPSGMSGPWATAYTVQSTQGLSGVGFGNGSFVAVGTGTCTQSGPCNSVVLKASASGRDWTQAATIPDEVDDVAYGNGKWLAVGGVGYSPTGKTGTVVYQSTDATTWTKVTRPAERLHRVRHADLHRLRRRPLDRDRRPGQREPDQLPAARQHRRDEVDAGRPGRRRLRPGGPR